MEPPDLALVEQAKERNERACRDLLQRIEGLIHAAIKQGAYVVPAADEDVLREELRVQVLLSLWRWDPERGSFSTWVYAIARNILNAYLRARSRRPPCVPLDARRHAAIPALQDPGDCGGRRVPPLVAVFWETVGGMSRDDQIVVDHLLDGAPHRQLALRLRVSEAAAKMRVHRVKERLRKLLLARWPGNGTTPNGRGRSAPDTRAPAPSDDRPDPWPESPG